MKVLLACGGTGGHVFPAVSVAEELKLRDPSIDIVYICGKKDIEHAIFRVVEGQRVVAIDSAPFRGRLSFANPVFLLRLMSGFVTALRLIRRERPQLVAGFGGHYAFPAICAARVLGVPTLIHEQNVVPGTANRVMARMVDALALSYAQSKGRIAGPRMVRVTGNPIRRSIERAGRAEALSFFGFSPERRTLLVLGGSQGSESVNRVFLEALGRLTVQARQRLQVLHLCGRMSPAEVETALVRCGVPGRAYTFFERMDLAYGVADMALGRAGATFLAEVASRGVPVILVPYPFAGQHQLENARVYAQNNEALVVDQSRLSGENLAVLIQERVMRPQAQAHAAAPSGARERLADLMMELIKK